MASGETRTVRAFATAFAEGLGAAELLRFGELAERPDAPSDLFASGARLNELLLAAGRGDALSVTGIGDVARMAGEG